MTHLFCATGNPGKLREFQIAAAHAPVEIELVPNFRQLPPAIEDGETFADNALRKAIHYSRYVPGLLFADDSGLEVDALNGAPGVYSARFAGPDATDEANNRLLLEKLRALPGQSFPFAARFVCRIALVVTGPRPSGSDDAAANHARDSRETSPQPRLVGIYSGSVEGQIVDAARGPEGFGYDPLFYYPPFDCTFGQASADAKWDVSHRGQALRALLQLFQ